MTHVVLGIGSNIERERNVHFALEALSVLGRLEVSPIVESDPVGYDSTSRFYNMVVGVDTFWTLADVRALCKRLERQSGRRVDEPRFSPKTLDIDLLLWGDAISETGQHPVLPHPDILRFGHVLRPLSLLYPARIHPVARTCYKELWEQHQRDFSPLTVLAPPNLA